MTRSSSLTAEDRKLRQTGIGASEIAAAVGEDPFRTPLELWLLKTGRVRELPTPPLAWGQRLESLVVDAFAARHGVALTPCRTLVHGELPWAFATPDRLIGGRRACLEVQNVGYRTMHLWRDESGGYRAPRHVQLKAQWQCLVGGFDACHIAALIGGRDDYDEAFPFDADVANDLIERATRFWRDHLVTDSPPPATGSDRDRAALTQLHPREDGVLSPSTTAVDELVGAFVAAEREEKAATTRKESARNRLRQLIGGGSGFTGSWGEVRWREIAGRTAWAKVAAEAGVPSALVDKHTGSPSRRLDFRLVGQRSAEDETTDG